jgi:DNA-binding MarR family transcriptional regulator
MSTDARLANEVWEALLTSHAVVVKGFAAEEIWHDVSMREYDVLYALSKCTQPMTGRELDRRLLLSQPALSRMVDRLVERGLVNREVDSADKRNLRLSLTDEGRECQRSVGRKHARSVYRAMNALTDAEMKTLQTLCNKLSAANEGE